MRTFEETAGSKGGDMPRGPNMEPGLATPASVGPQLPPLGLGCWAFGGGSYWGHQEQSDVDRVVSRALEAGLNYFDTAEAYNEGASETSLGKALQGRRAEALIGSKVSPNNAYPDRLRIHCEQSLRRLNTDYIDIYMIHWPLNSFSVSHFTADEEVILNPPDIASAMEALGELRQEGKIRYVGVSNFGRRQLAEAAALGVPIAVDEIPYNLLMRAAENSLLPYCAEHGIKTLGYSALMQGLLARPVTELEEIPPVRMRTRHFSHLREGSRHQEEGIEAETLVCLSEIAGIASDFGSPIAEVALAWAMANEHIGCTLVGCRTLHQLEKNLRSLKLTLSPDIKRALGQVTEGVKRKLGDRIDYFQGQQQTRSW